MMPRDSRRGAALLVVLLVLLLAEVVAGAVAAVALSEVRAGGTWTRLVESELATGNLVDSLLAAWSAPGGWRDADSAAGYTTEMLQDSLLLLRLRAPGTHGTVSAGLPMVIRVVGTDTLAAPLLGRRYLVPPP